MGAWLLPLSGVHNYPAYHYTDKGASSVAGVCLDLAHAHYVQMCELEIIFEPSGMKEHGLAENSVLRE